MIITSTNPPTRQPDPMTMTMTIPTTTTTTISDLMRSLMSVRSTIKCHEDSIRPELQRERELIQTITNLMAKQRGPVVCSVWEENGITPMVLELHPGGLRITSAIDGEKAGILPETPAPEPTPAP